MPLNKQQLENQIYDLLDERNRAIDEDEDPKVAMRNYAKKLADAIDVYVKTGLVKVSVTVNTTGTASAQSGGGNGTGTIE